MCLYVMEREAVCFSHFSLANYINDKLVCNWENKHGEVTKVKPQGGEEYTKN